MDYSFVPTRYQLRVLSAVSANFSVVWLAASFVTRDAVTLLFNLLLGTLALLIAMILERMLEAYDTRFN